MERIDEFRVRVDTPNGPVIIFANEGVLIDRASVEEIIAFNRIHETVAKLKEVGYLPDYAAIRGPIETPDFHKVGGIPVGTCFEADGLVVPKAVGGDIGCGMRFLTTDMKRSEFDALGDKLDQIIRHIYFEGARGIGLSADQREKIFSLGIPGLCLTKHDKGGIWSYWDEKQQKEDIQNLHQHGFFGAYWPLGQKDEVDRVRAFFGDFIKGSGNAYTFDDQTGSIGGGNHFVEIQVIEETYDRHKSYEWGLRKDEIAIMVHSGSVGIGQVIGKHYTDVAKSKYPEHLRHDHDFYMLSAYTPGDKSMQMSEYMNMMSAAANFAFVNRLFLGIMMVRALSEAVGRRIQAKLVWDAPHNLVWRKQIADPNSAHIHRKGATPAYSGEPVIIPGSMGSSSFILVGHGSDETYCSACHGAGRQKARQSSRKGSSDDRLSCRVVTKIDPRTVRRDIAAEHMKSLMEEAPWQYKPITPVIETVEGAGIATRVARTMPLLTVKGL